MTDGRNKKTAGRPSGRRTAFVVGGIVFAVVVGTVAVVVVRVLLPLVPHERWRIRTLRRSPEASAEEKKRAALAILTSKEENVLALLEIDPTKRDVNQGVLGPHTLGQVFTAAYPAAAFNRYEMKEEKWREFTPRLKFDDMRWYLLRYNAVIAETLSDGRDPDEAQRRWEAAGGLLAAGAEGLEILNVDLTRRSATEALGRNTLEKIVALAMTTGPVVPQVRSLEQTPAGWYPAGWPVELGSLCQARLGPDTRVITFWLGHLPARFGSTNGERRKRLVAEIKGIIPASEWEKTSVGLQPWVGSLHPEFVSVIQSQANVEVIFKHVRSLAEEKEQEASPTSPPPSSRRTSSARG